MRAPTVDTSATLKSCTVRMQLANQLELCLHKQTQIVASVACRVGS